jgi:hypothetical protein
MLPAGSDPRSVVIVDDSTGFVTNLKDDSVVEIDPTALTLGRRIAVDSARGILYTIGAEGIWRIDPAAAGSSPTLLLASRAYSDLGFYSVGLAPLGDLYIGYTRGFTIPGSALVVDRQGNVITTFATGLNPGAFGSY